MIQGALSCFACGHRCLFRDACAHPIAHPGYPRGSGWRLLVRLPPLHIFVNFFVLSRASEGAFIGTLSVGGVLDETSLTALLQRVLLCVLCEYIFTPFAAAAVCEGSRWAPASHGRFRILTGILSSQRQAILIQDFRARTLRLCMSVTVLSVRRLATVLGCATDTAACH